MQDLEVSFMQDSSKGHENMSNYLKGSCSAPYCRQFNIHHIDVSSFDVFVHHIDAALM